MADDPRAHRAQELAAAIVVRRRRLGLTQIDLARFAGCGPDFIYDLESGKPTVRLDKVLDVLVVLGLELRLGNGKAGLVVDDSVRTDPPEPKP